MARMLGKLPEPKKRPVVRALMSLLSETARLVAELEEGRGPHLLAERLRQMGLPEAVTIILRPTLGFLHADLCLIAPGRVLVINALHWAGEIACGRKGEWTGAGGSADLGRPDRRARLFCDRLAYSGLAAGFELEPVVVFTAGPVRYLGGEPEATLVQWEELEPFLQSRLPRGAAPVSADALIRAITPQQR